MINSYRIEWLCFKQHIHFSLRNRRYLSIAISQHLYSFYNWQQAKNLRYTFCTLQLIDDLLDGDRFCETEPLQIIEKLKKAIEQDQYDSSEVHLLTRALLSRIQNNFLANDEATHAVYRLIDIMMEDRKRVIGRKIFTQQELRDQHHSTFSYSLDIVFMAIQSPLRAKDLPEILDIFAWCSTVRDLKDDLDKNLINIPLEITSQIPHFLALTSTGKITCPEVSYWLNQETTKAIQSFGICEKKMKDLKETKGAFIFSLFLKSMKKYTKYHF